MTDIATILTALESGDSRAAAELLPLVYDELGKLAAVCLAGEKPGHTFQATALVHEACLRLVDGNQQFQGRGPFFAAAASRHFLVDSAQRKARPKRGGRLRDELLEDLPAPAGRLRKAQQGAKAMLDREPLKWWTAEVVHRGRPGDVRGDRGSSAGLRM